MRVFAELSPPYATIVADPPWRYRNTSPTWGAGTRGRAPAVFRRGPAAQQQYSTMTCDQLMTLPVTDLAASAAHLYLWVTNPLMFGDATGSPAQILQAWGFRYITTLTWLKQGAMGMGYYFRGETEHVLFAVRGAAPIEPARRERNWFAAAKGAHSRKPASFMDMVERVSPGPYLELFSREPRFGWDSWGKGYEQKASA